MAGDHCTEHGEAIARLEVEVDSLKQTIPSKLDEILTQVKSTNGRLRKVELWKAWLTGGVVFLGMAASAAATAWGLIK